MPYNGSGSFSLAESPFVPNTPISSTAVNSDLSDIATGLSTAVTKDGQTTITAAFKGFSGTVALPMYSFSTDPDSGMYRIGANNLGIGVNAANVLDIATTGLTVTGALSVSGAATVGALTASGDVSFLPAGVIVPYAGSAAPTGWLICNGASLLRASFPALFTAIGTTYGAADGTHFSLPDCTGRTIAGKEASATRLTTAVCGIDGATLGAAGGSQSQTLTEAQLPVVTKTATMTADGVPALVGQFPGTVTGGVTPITFLNFVANTPQLGASITFGSGTAHANVQPTIVMNYIIRT